MRPWVSNTRKQEKRGKAVQFSNHRRSAPRVPRSGMEARPPSELTQEGLPKQLAFAVELRFNHDGEEVGVDDAQICLTQRSLKELIEEYDSMGITFKVVAVIAQGEKIQEHAIPPGKITKRWRRFIIEQATSRPGVTIAVAGHSPNPHRGNVVEPACLYIRSNYPRE